MSADEGLRDFHQRWSTLCSPLRPDAQVARAILRELTQDPRPVLLLGVTPELAALPRPILAVDWSERMVRLAWPGDTLRRRSVLGDWKAMPIADGAVCAAMGDGALTMLSYPDETRRVIDGLAAILADGGRAVLRCFATPESVESLAAIRDAALSGTIAFHAFKLRFNMAVARADGGVNISSARLFEAFEALFPDRDALSRASGWSLAAIAEIDAYRGSAYVHSYPGEAELRAVAERPGRRVRFAPSGDYILAERCPLLIVEFD